MKRFIEAMVNRITMYRLTSYCLGGLVGVSLVAAAAGWLDVPVTGLVASLVILLAASFAVNRLAAWTFSTVSNIESGLITALIIFFIVPPVESALAALGVAIVALLAESSKYLLAVRGRHILNPAALAVAGASIAGIAPAAWWVATPVLLPFVVVVGVLIVAKTRQYVMSATFMVVAFAVALVLSVAQGFTIAEVVQSDVLSGPLVFFAAIMLTEPLTSPGTRKWQIVYALLVGVLYSSQLPWLAAPATALLVGNVFAFVVSQRRAQRLRVVDVQRIGKDVYRISTRPDAPLVFLPGQYAEVALPHGGADARGVRRMLSIASAPHETSVEFGISAGEQRSSFKNNLLAPTDSTSLRVVRVGGDFVLPRDTSVPLLFIAGGIGITPFRSMLADLIERGEQRDIVLLYATNTVDSLVYLSVIGAAVEQLTIAYVPVIAKPTSEWRGETGFITEDVIARHVTDLSERMAYVSGPPVMVENMKRVLKKAGARRVVTDYFSGY